MSSPRHFIVLYFPVCFSLCLKIVSDWYANCIYFDGAARAAGTPAIQSVGLDRTQATESNINVGDGVFLAIFGHFLFEVNL